MMSDNKKYGFELATELMLSTIRSEKYQITNSNINKPIKSISSYKLEELISICKKLEIETFNLKTKKTNKKSELYEKILQALNI